MYIDASALRKFSAGINANAKTTPRKVRAVVEKGAVNIKNQLQREMGASGSFGHLAGGINYDMAGGGGVDELVIEAEIGPSKKFSGRRKAPRRGANIAYFGTSKGGGSVPDPRGALMSEAPKLEKFLLDIGEEVVP